MSGRITVMVKGAMLAFVCVTAIQCAPAISSFVIGGGEATSNTRQVTLTFVPAAAAPSDAATHYLASESPTFAGASWVALTSAPQFTLSAGNGVKTVYFKVRNAKAQESTVSSDTIMLIETTPLKWARAIDVGSFSSDEGYAITPMADGGYVVGGLTMPAGGDGTSQAVLMKLAANGAPALVTTFGVPMENEILSVVKQTLDNGLIVAGGIYDDASNSTKVFAAKFTANLDQVWFQTYALTPDISSAGLTSYASDVTVLASGGFIVAGTANFDAVNGVGGDMFLLRLNGAGSQVDLGLYGAAGDTDFGNAVTETSDGNLVLAGQRISGGASKSVLLKVQASLTNRAADLSVLWSHDFYGDLASDVLSIADGSVVYCGFVTAGPDNSNEGFTGKVSGDGVQDDSFGAGYGGPGMDALNSIAQDLDGGFVLAGSASSFGNGSQAYLVKTDPQGKLVFQKNFGDANTDDAKSIAVTPDGGFILAGFTETGGGARNGDLLVIKTDSRGQSGAGITP